MEAGGGGGAAGGGAAGYCASACAEKSTAENSTKRTANEHFFTNTPTKLRRPYRTVCQLSDLP